MSNEERSSKRQKKRSIEDDLVCPITLELTFDPVTAEDGHVYERSAIEKHFEQSKSKRGKVKSPMTGLRMGRRLLPATQHKNTIEASIENGFITGDLADKWKTSEQEKKDTEKLLKKAEAGDVDAIEDVAENFYHGEAGFTIDFEKAFIWFEKAHRAGSVRGTTLMGHMIFEGHGVHRNPSKGLLYLGIAAGQGSDYSAFILGKVFAKGHEGVPIDKPAAIHWLQKALLGCPFKILDTAGVNEARKLLDKLTKEE